MSWLKINFLNLTFWNVSVCGAQSCWQTNKIPFTSNPLCTGGRMYLETHHIKPKLSAWLDTTKVAKYLFFGVFLLWPFRLKLRDFSGPSYSESQFYNLNLFKSQLMLSVLLTAVHYILPILESSEHTDWQIEGNTWINEWWNMTNTDVLVTHSPFHPPQPPSCTESVALNKNFHLLLQAKVNWILVSIVTYYTKIPDWFVAEVATPCSRPHPAWQWYSTWRLGVVQHRSSNANSMRKSNFSGIVNVNACDEQHKLKYGLVMCI